MDAEEPRSTLYAVVTTRDGEDRWIRGPFDLNEAILDGAKYQGAANELLREPLGDQCRVVRLVDAVMSDEIIERARAIYAQAEGQPMPTQRDEGAATYRVTEAETVYSFYHVGARTPDEAVALVQSSQATLVSESAPREDRRVVAIEVWEP